MLLGNGKKRELRIEVDKLLDNNFLHIATRALHRLLESLFQFALIVHIALTMTRGRHQGLHHTGEANLVGSLLKLVIGLGIEVLSCAQPQLLGSEVTDGTTIHGIVDGTGGGDHLDALLLKLEQALRTDSLNLRNDDVGLMFVDYSLKGIAIEH